MKNREKSIAEIILAKIPALAGRVFINNLPAEILSGVLIKEGYSGMGIDPEITGWRKGRFQVAVRDTRARYEAGQAIAEAVSDALDIPGEYQVPDGILIKHCRPLNEPISYPVSDGNNVEFVVNFQIAYVVQH